MQYNNHDHDYNTTQRDNNDCDTAISWQWWQQHLNLHYAMLSALSTNASGLAAAAFLATLISLMLAVPSVGAGAAYAPHS
jgi:hypothetical protein